MPTLRKYKDKQGVYIRASIDGKTPFTYQVNFWAAKLLGNLGYGDGDALPWEVVRPLVAIGDIYTRKSGHDPDATDRLEAISKRDLAGLSPTQRELLAEYLSSRELTESQAAAVEPLLDVLGENVPTEEDVGAESDPSAGLHRLVEAFDAQIIGRGTDDQSTPADELVDLEEFLLQTTDQDADARAILINHYGRRVDENVISELSDLLSHPFNVVCLGVRRKGIIWEVETQQFQEWFVIDTRHSENEYDFEVTFNVRSREGESLYTTYLVTEGCISSKVLTAKFDDSKDLSELTPYEAHQLQLRQGKLIDAVMRLLDGMSNYEVRDSDLWNATRNFKYRNNHEA